MAYFSLPNGGGELSYGDTFLVGLLFILSLFFAGFVFGIGFCCC